LAANWYVFHKALYGTFPLNPELVYSVIGMFPKKFTSGREGPDPLLGTDKVDLYEIVSHGEEDESMLLGLVDNNVSVLLPYDFVKIGEDEYVVVFQM